MASRSTTSKFEGSLSRPRLDVLCVICVVLVRPVLMCGVKASSFDFGGSWAQYIDQSGSLRATGSSSLGLDLPGPEQINLRSIFR
ncbi:hypothetical protein PGT21_030435 [Puccinia graminis f. sp. tritici]|uniref:Uncharacterized protein n=1 Tax=Puccinia graminis f. sp. tritici TaxID=56615 RepID=A0A5B0MHC9_PUCGR|nr:hypothetical protein PGT21_030435 [Puccinia graminis f. sp. tritici]